MFLVKKRFRVILKRKKKVKRRLLVECNKETAVSRKVKHLSDVAKIIILPWKTNQQTLIYIF